MNNSDVSTTITYDKVREEASEIRECSRNMEVVFDNFINIMRAVGADDVFAGNASESLTSKFLQLKNKLHIFTDTVEDFSASIFSAADSTEATENSIAADIDAFL